MIEVRTHGQHDYQKIRELLDRVRARWRALSALQRAGARRCWSRRCRRRRAAGGALDRRRAGGADGARRPLPRCSPSARWSGALAPLRRVPADKQVARFIEERAPSLDDRLVTAVDVAQARRTAPALADLMIADAARAIVGGRRRQPSCSGESLRRAGFQARRRRCWCSAVVLFASRGPARQAVDAAVAGAVSRSRRASNVTPGNARLQAGTPLTIEARLVGNRAPVIAQLQIARRRSLARQRDDQRRRRRLPRCRCASVAAPFKYRVVAGAVTSPTYEIAVARSRRASRASTSTTPIPRPAARAAHRDDGGDIYAPAGTDVRLHVYTDRPAATGQMTLGGGQPLALQRRSRPCSSASLKVSSDDSYRVGSPTARASAAPGDTEYFIRMLDDRPPDVRVAEAGDRSIGHAARGSRRRGAGPGRLRRRAPRSRLLGAGRRREGRAAADPARSASVTGQPHPVSRRPRRPAGRLRLLLRAGARPDARHAAERGAQRHLLPRSQAVRAGVRAGAEPAATCRAAARAGSTTSSRRRRKSSSRPGSSIAASRAANGAQVRAGHQGGGARRGRAEDPRRADVELVPRRRRCAIRAAASRSAARRRRPRFRRSRRRPSSRRPDDARRRRDDGGGAGHGQGGDVARRR